LYTIGGDAPASGIPIAVAATNPAVPSLSRNRPMHATQNPATSRAPSRREIRQAAAAIRRSWNQPEREFRREVGVVQRKRLVATLIRAAA
jgi:hypothetical protein